MRDNWSEIEGIFTDGTPRIQISRKKVTKVETEKNQKETLLLKLRACEQTEQ